ncbi:unnamed protein product [Mortierella alpina]
MVISPITMSLSSTSTLEESTPHPSKHNHTPCSVQGDSNTENPSLFLFNSISSRNKGPHSHDATEVDQTSHPSVALSTVAVPPLAADFASSRRHDAESDYTSMLQQFSTASLRLDHQSLYQKRTNFLSPQCPGQGRENNVTQEGFVPRYAAAHSHRVFKAQYNHFHYRQRGWIDFHHLARIRIFLGYLEDIDTVPEDVRYWHDDTCFIIKDRYPKAMVHYLVMPREKIIKPRFLAGPHGVQVVEELQHRGQWLIERLKAASPELDFTMGFHVLPSMLQLHLHVISTDFCSDNLRSKAHYNAFTTRFLITPEEVLQVLNERGAFYLTPNEIYDYRECKILPLQCNQCHKAYTSMQVLKIHLQTHLQERLALAQRGVLKDRDAADS